jgi:DNA-binding NarL/FixJ family response regulator
LIERESEEENGFGQQTDSGNSVVAWVSAREIISLLSARLPPQEKAVLGCLADGLGPREIGRKLHVSHTMVIKHRRKIASLLSHLEAPSLGSLTTRGPRWEAQ